MYANDTLQYNIYNLSHSMYNYTNQGLVQLSSGMTVCLRKMLRKGNFLNHKMLFLSVVQL